MAFMPLRFSRLCLQSGLGLHLEAAELSLVELRGHPRHALHVQTHGSMELPTDAVVDGQIRRLQDVVDAARDLMIRCGVRSSRAVLSLPVRCVLLRTLAVPEGSGPQEWQDQARLEAAAMLQSDPRDLCVDCDEVQRGRRGGARQVFTAAVRRERVEALVQLAQTLGLELRAVEVEHHAAQRAVLRWCEQQARQRPTGDESADRKTASTGNGLLVEFGRQFVRLSRPHGAEGVIERESWGGSPAPIEVIRLVERARAMTDGAAPDAVLLAGASRPSAWVEEFRTLSRLPVVAVDSRSLAQLAHEGHPWAFDVDHRAGASNEAPHLVAFGLALRSLSC